MADLTNDDLIALLASAPDRLDAALAANTRPEPAPQPGVTTGEGEWTTSELVGHLCDAARYWGGRMRLVAYEDEPALPVYDQDTFVRLAAYRYVPAATLAREFRLISEANVALLRGLRPEAWQRVGRHEERGRLTLRALVEIEAEHEGDHVRQLADSR
ncbi:MAG TPA: DinB family protein [Ktedonobacterales bacterium]